MHAININNIVVTSKFPLAFVANEERVIVDLPEEGTLIVNHEMGYSIRNKDNNLVCSYEASIGDSPVHVKTPTGGTVQFHRATEGCLRITLWWHGVCSCQMERYKGRLVSVDIDIFDTPTEP